MQLNKWLTGLAPCIVLLFLLSLSWVDVVEGKRGGRRRHRTKGGGRHGRRHGPGPDPPGGPDHPGVGKGPHTAGHVASVITVPTAQACPNPPPIGDVKKNLTDLWKEVHQLSNPLHIHVHGGQADGGHPRSSCGHSPGKKGHSHRRTPGGKGHDHPHTPGGKGHPHPHTPGGKGHHHPHTPGGKGHHHPHSPGGKGKHTPGGQGPGHTKRSHHRSRHSPHSRETHIHIHITLDTKNETDKNETDKCKKPNETEDYKYARCDLRAHEKGSPVTGTVLLRQKPDEPLEVKVNVSGMPVAQSHSTADENSQHGFHVHEFADFSNGCISFGGHYNPKNTTHGHENGEDSHAGDWGNIECDKDGKCVAAMNITISDLLGPFSITGRGIVLHAMEDDLGKGGDKGSLTTGNAGKRVACCGVVRTGPPAEGDW